MKVKDYSHSSCSHTQLLLNAHSSHACWAKATLVLDLCFSLQCSTSTSLTLAVVFTTNLIVMQPLLTPKK